MPTVRQWLKQEKKSVPELIEPFAGGGIVSLTAAFERLADEILMVEMDDEIAAVWEVILSEKNKWLDRISFRTGDAFEVLEQNMENDKAYFFIDPP